MSASPVEVRETRSTHRSRGAGTVAPWTIVLLGWLALLASGLHLAWKYESAKGLAANAPLRWPPRSALPRAAHESLIVLFVHPLCGCSRASLAELNAIMNRSPRASAVVLFQRLAGTGASAESSPLWQRAGELPRTRRVVDEGGAEASLFGVRTSGQAFVYGPQGQLVFSGGLTASRGHEGESSARSSALLALNNTIGEEGSPVYGCPLDALAAGTDSLP